MSNIRIAVSGFGNLARGIVDNLPNFHDLELTAVFSRRPNEVKAPCEVFSAADLALHKDVADVLILCGGSATDLPKQTPDAVQYFNVVDSFDNHAKIPAHFKAVDEVAQKHGKLGLISGGWDPGLFSMTRAMFNSFLPNGSDYTFWGKGVSQGHSDAIRRVAGVKRAVQYTIPKEQALKAVRGGSSPKLSTRDKHLRECFVVATADADMQEIERQIVTMPNYFADYDTVVHFISEEEFDRNHTGMPHGGFVMRGGKSTADYGHMLELSIKLGSNPHFTSGILLAYARAVSRMSKEGMCGCVTPFDVPLSKLYIGSNEELRAKLL